MNFMLMPSLLKIQNDEVNPSELWHIEYAHPNYQALPFLKNMVEGIPKIQSTHEGFCRGCALGKNVNNPFSNSNNKSKEILDLIHSGICGPMPVKSLGGSHYYVIFIDDYIRKTWGLLQCTSRDSQSEIMSILKIWH